MKRIPTLVAISMMCVTLQAQVDSSFVKPFSHLKGGITLGTTGIGFEATAPIARDWDVRAGFDFMPHFHYNMEFGVTVGDDNTDKDISKSRFKRMASTFHDLTGYTVDDKIVMEGVPKYYNFRLLVDYKPFHDKRWHITAGFYWGNSKIAVAENSKEDMTSLFSVGLYNQIYEKAYNLEPLINYQGTNIYLPTELENRILEYGRMNIHVGTYKRDIPYKENVYYDEDVYEYGELIHKKGDIMYRAGVDIEHKKGDEYNMEPGEDCMVRVTAKANKFKPFIGFGYMGQLTRKDPRWQVGFDAGAMFWGGVPDLKTHDGTDLIHDVNVSRKKVRHYVKLFKLAEVMPVINFRITRTIF